GIRRLPGRDLPRRIGGDPPGVLRSCGGGRGRRVAAVSSHYLAAAESDARLLRRLRHHHLPPTLHAGAQHDVWGSGGTARQHPDGRAVRLHPGVPALPYGTRGGRDGRALCRDPRDHARAAPVLFPAGGVLMATRAAPGAAVTRSAAGQTLLPRRVRGDALAYLILAAGGALVVFPFLWVLAPALTGPRGMCRRAF